MNFKSVIQITSLSLDKWIFIIDQTGVGFGKFPLLQAFFQEDHVVSEVLMKVHLFLVASIPDQVHQKVVSHASYGLTIVALIMSAFCVCMLL